ncbi:MAG: hypothetical protein ABL933_15855 [Methyloglobulus sp.]
MFAKLYGEINQVLVKLDTNDEGNPELRFYTKPEGLGVCSLALEFADTDEGWDKAEKALREMTAEMVYTMANKIKESTKDFVV